MIGSAAGTVLVIGVGNALRHDDDAGLEVARRARAIAAGEAREPPIGFREHEGEMLGLLEVWEGARAAVLADAVHGTGRPGSVHRFDASSRPLPASLAGSGSTHAIGLAEAIELGRALGRLPPRLIVYGVAGRRFEAGTGLSPAVSEVLDRVAGRVLREARSLAAAR